MTNEEIKNTPELVDFMLDKCVLADSRAKVRKRLEEVCDMAIKALEQEPCEDCVSREEVHNLIIPWLNDYLLDETREVLETIDYKVGDLPPVTSQPKTGHCKECKHFEYDSVAKVDGVPLIVAHEICSRWGDGCKTSEDGYCFLFEPKMQEVKR